MKSMPKGVDYRYFDGDTTFIRTTFIGMKFSRMTFRRMTLSRVTLLRTIYKLG
jgi:hypothetical protein